MALDVSDDVVQCPACEFQTVETDGVLPLLTAEQLEKYARFLETYTAVRITEGRGSYDHATLRALPNCNRSLPQANQWRIRAHSYRVLRKLLRRKLDTGTGILDLGAGTGWLSNRLCEAGYRPCSIDLSINSQDGLGAAEHFAVDWPRLQAPFGCLPLADDSADAAIFNASFHYCADQAETLAEALRVIKPGGLVVILDSPIYADAASGKQMLIEQQEYFERLIGERSDSIETSGFLTWQGLEQLGERLQLDWNVVRPWYGLRWALRPSLAKLRRKREPATFAIISARTP
jgi:ubiquinone/menaquinone biosynthesis C-methylase UbiE